MAVDEKLVTSYTLVDVTNDIFGPPNIISARYDYSVSNGEQAGYDECLKDCFTYPFDTRVFVITLAFSLALIAIAIIPRYVQQFRSKNDQRRVVSQIANQIRSVQIELSNDRSSRVIFMSQFWNITKKNRRREIFDNYDDYNEIDNFYQKLKERDAIFMKENIDKEVIDRQNAISLGLANSASKIDWAKYYDGKIISIKLRKRYSLLFPAIILGSLCITYLCEGLPFYFLSQQFALFSFIISLLARTIASYFILVYIIKNIDPTAEEFADEYRSKKQTTFFLNKHKRAKLFMLCAGIIGLPSYYLVSFFLSYGTILGISPSIVVYNYLPIIILLLDLIRISVLLLVTYRFVLKTTDATHSLYYYLAIVTIMSGFMNLSFGWVLYFSATNYFNESISMLSGAFPTDILKNEVPLTSSFFSETLINFTRSAVTFFFIPVGIVQVLWALPLIKRARNVWLYTGLGGASLLSIVWLLAVIATSIGLNEASKEGGFTDTFAGTEYIFNVQGIWPILFLIGLIIAIANLVYVLLSIVLIQRIKAKHEPKSNMMKETLIFRKTRTITNLLIPVAGAASIIFFGVIAGFMTPQHILGPIDKSIPNEVSNEPIDLMVNPNDSQVYVLNQGLHGVVESGNELSAKVTGFDENASYNYTMFPRYQEPNSLLVNPINNKVYVADGSGAISVFDLSSYDYSPSNEIKLPIKASEAPVSYDMVLNPETNAIYVYDALDTQGIIYEINSTKEIVKPREPLNSAIMGLAVNGKESLLYALTRTSGRDVSPSYSLITLNVSDNFKRTGSEELSQFSDEYSYYFNDFTDFDVIFNEKNNNLYVTSDSAPLIYIKNNESEFSLDLSAYSEGSNYTLPILADMATNQQTGTTYLCDSNGYIYPINGINILSTIASPLSEKEKENNYGCSIDINPVTSSIFLSTTDSLYSNGSGSGDFIKIGNFVEPIPEFFQNVTGWSKLNTPGKINESK